MICAGAWHSVRTGPHRGLDERRDDQEDVGSVHDYEGARPHQAARSLSAISAGLVNILIFHGILY